MNRSNVVRSLVVVLLLALAPLPAFAGGHRAPWTGAPAGLLASLWDAVTGLFPSLAKLGSGMDPNGLTAPGRPGGDDGSGTAGPDAPPGTTSDLGSAMDPDG
jgi:hypothetical protein